MKFIIFVLIPLILSIGITPAISFGEIDSPRKQMANGIIAEDVTCKSGLTLMIRSSGSAACVTSTTAEKLEIVGWGTIQPESMKETMLSASEAKQIAEDAYIFGYPLVIMKLTMLQMTNVIDTSTQSSPVNQFAHFPEFPDASFTTVVRPNADTLYSSAWLDLGEEPIILHVPDTADRYYLMPLLDAYTNVFESIGKRTTGTGENDYIITSPFWDGAIPDGMIQVESPTDIVWIIGRTQTNGVSDYDAVHKIQEQYTLTPLSSLGGTYTPPSNEVIPEIDMITPPVLLIDQVEDDVYFNHMANLMKNNPPTSEDVEIIKSFAKIGLIPGEEFDLNSLDPEIITAIETGMQSGREKLRVEATENIGEVVKGWQIPSGLGLYGTDYLYRSVVSIFGLGANLDADSIYPSTFVDGDDDILNGAYNYVLHFEEEQIPPVNAFWSLTMYDGDFFYDNEINRYAIGDRDALEFNEDGSLDIFIQHESPEGNESNWLPASEGDFNLTIRMYWPQEAAFDGTWQVPPVQKVE